MVPQLFGWTLVRADGEDAPAQTDFADVRAASDKLARAQTKLTLCMDELSRKVEGGFADLRGQIAKSQIERQEPSLPMLEDVVTALDALDAALQLEILREQSDLQEQRLSSLIRTVLELHQLRPDDSSIGFDVLLPMPGNQPPRALSMLLQVIHSPPRHPALLISLDHEHH